MSVLTNEDENFNKLKSVANNLAALFKQFIHDQQEILNEEILKATKELQRKHQVSIDEKWKSLTKKILESLIFSQEQLTNEEFETMFYEIIESPNIKDQSNPKIKNFIHNFINGDKSTILRFEQGMKYMENRWIQNSKYFKDLINDVKINNPKPTEKDIKIILDFYAYPFAYTRSSIFNVLTFDNEYDYNGIQKLKKFGVDKFLSDVHDTQFNYVINALKMLKRI
jgi:hypothetical protein